jgi:hypothetical protein
VQSSFVLGPAVKAQRSDMKPRASAVARHPRHALSQTSEDSRATVARTRDNLRVDAPSLPGASCRAAWWEPRVHEGRRDMSRTWNVACAALLGTVACGPPVISLNKNVQGAIQKEVCEAYNISPATHPSAVQYTTGVVVTKEGDVALGSTTIFAVATGKYTNAESSQIQVTYVQADLATMCAPALAAAVKANAVPVFQQYNAVTLEAVKP